MPENETNDDNNTNKRPKRRAAQRVNTYHYETTSIWSEDKDLKKALLASLQDVKKSSSKDTSVCGQSVKSNANQSINSSGIYSKLNTHNNNSEPNNCKESRVIGDNNSCSLLSLAALRKAKVSAQRKFAQSCGSNNNSPVSTPIKIGFVPPTNAVELFPNQKPKTEDFLTFLCLRRSPILPPNLDFIRLNSCKKESNKKNEKVDTDSENTSCDEYERNNNDISCRLRDSDRRGSASSNGSKATSLCSKSSFQISNNKISEKNENISKLKRSQSISCESGLKNVKRNSISQSGPALKRSHSRTKIELKSKKDDNQYEKSFHTLKEKYKQQRIVKKSNNPSNSVKTGKDEKGKDFKGIQTRQQLRNYSFIEKESKSGLKSNKSSNISQRVLRSHRSDSCTHSMPSLPTPLFSHNVNRKKLKAFNSSQIGIRPQKRKAKPVVPLIDYYFDSEFESDSSKKNTRSNQKKGLDSTEVKSKSKKTLNGENSKSKNLSNNKLSVSEKEIKTLGRPKGSTKLANKAKTSLSSEPKRLTRSSRSLSPSNETRDLERERLIKQQIIEIEKKHKRLRRFPSDQSLHSSASSSSSSSSESLPNSSSSSSSINFPRLTRSLEHLKKMRDIAAKLKREQKKRKEEKKKLKTDSVSKNKSKNITEKTNKDEKNNSKETTDLSKRNKCVSKPLNRCSTRRMNDSVVTQTSDTDCDTEDDEENDEWVGTEDSMTSIVDGDMERASIVIQDMAEDINALLVNSENDLQYGSAEHIEGLMTTEFSGAFSDETVTTASAILLPSNSVYNYIQQIDHTTQTRSTVDASTNTTDDDILSCISSDDTQTSNKSDSNSNKLQSVATQTFANSSAQTDI